MRSKSRLPASGRAFSALLSGVALLAGAQVAFADTTANPSAGVLRLPNVRIVTPTDGQRAAMARLDASSGQSAVRAYKDPLTGELRDQTPEEMMEGGLSKAVTKPAAKSFTSPYGGTIMPLDDSYMSNSVVTKDATGRLRMQCVTGAETASDIVLKGKAVKEQRHDH